MFANLKVALARIFGATKGEPPVEARAEAVEHNGFRIRPAPYPSRGGFQTAGVIEKDFPNGLREHRFVRAETHPTLEEAAAFAIAKGRQIVNEQGDRLFPPGA